jgi:hypothetical protein
MGGISPRDMADIYARNISALTEYMATSARIATNVLFAGLEAMKTTTNYARQNSKELARVTANTARTLGQASRETIVRGQEGSSGGSTTHGGIRFESSTTTATTEGGASTTTGSSTTTEQTRKR